MANRALTKTDIKDILVEFHESVAKKDMQNALVEFHESVAKKDMQNALVEFHESVVKADIQNAFMEFSDKVMMPVLEEIVGDIKDLKKDVGQLSRKTDLIAERLTDVTTNHERRLRRVEDELEIEAVVLKA